MGTDYPEDTVRSKLASENWTVVVQGIEAMSKVIEDGLPSQAPVEEGVALVSKLAAHRKWEVRYAVANAAGRTVHQGFEGALVRLARDDNALVRQAAERAALRRRDWRDAHALGKQHDRRINAVLDDMEGRFGVRARDAVKRASQEIANTFARELYHEVIKLVSPLAMSADRLRRRLLDDAIPKESLVEEAARMASQVQQLQAVLDGMRSYTAVPTVVFSSESVEELVREGCLLAQAATAKASAPAISIDIDPSLTVEVSRPRLIQALTNVVLNALESYNGERLDQEVSISAEAKEGRIDIMVTDHGCGMSKENLADATALFATNKPNGTGFGLPLALKIVESEHGGRVILESESGRGSRVIFHLPAYQRRTEHESS